MFPIPLSPQTLENTAIYTVFLQFFHVPMPLANSNIYTKNPSKTFFYSVFTCFSVKNTVICTFFGIKSVPNTGFCSVFKALASKKLSLPWSPQTLENTAIYTVFFNFFHVPMPLANSNIYTKNPSKTFFCSVFTCFSVKNTVIYTFFSLKSVQDTGFCSAFNALASKNHSKYRYLHCFFMSVRFSLAGSRPKWPKIPFQWPLKLRHPKIVAKTRRHHQYEVSVRNPGLGAKSFLGPPPQPKLI